MSGFILLIIFSASSLIDISKLEPIFITSPMDFVDSAILINAFTVSDIKVRSLVG
jgi:hypothetical protein